MNQALVFGANTIMLDYFGTQGSIEFSPWINLGNMTVNLDSGYVEVLGVLQVHQIELQEELSNELDEE